MSGSKPSRLALGWVVTLLLGLVPQVSQAQFSPTDLKCRETISKLGAKLAQQAAKVLNECHTKRVDGAIPPTTNCNSTITADLKDKIQKAAVKLNDGVPAACSGNPADLNYIGCPFPCGTNEPVITDYTQVAACIECTTRYSVETMTGSAQGNPGLPLGEPEARCHDSIGGNQTKHFRTVLKEKRKCQKTAEKGGATSVTGCIDADPKGKIAKARTKVDALLEPACNGASLAQLDSCAEITLDALESCVFDNAAASSSALGKRIFRSLYELNPGGNSTTTTFNNSTTSTTTTTTGGGGAQDPQCPDKAELILYAGTRGQACDDNNDCGGFGECNLTLARCETVSELDTGWTGIAHDADIIDEAATLANLVCPGPAPVCGECTIDGLNPDPGYCRCANDNRAICDQPFVADANDCGGDLCNCYFGVPLPLSSGNTPACVVNRFREDITGSTNVDLGEGETQVRLASVVYLGESTLEPCPSCGGTCTAPPSNVGDRCSINLHCDTTPGTDDGVCSNFDPIPNDGNRQGTCRAGLNDGQSCDAGSRHETFPAPGGATHSLDCFPDPGLNVSGSGLRINLDQTTGVRQLTAAVECGQPPFVVDLCHCGQCSNNATIACTSNGDCANPGVCQRVGNLVPFVNQCAADNICNDAGGGEGVCNQGPSDGACDGIVAANGEGFLKCSGQADCNVFPNGIAGNCSLTKTRECFLDTIVATGQADPQFPVGAATFCIAQTSNGGINSVAGLPGPGRVVNQGSVTFFCASNPNVTYTPNVGGCP